MQKKFEKPNEKNALRLLLSILKRGIIDIECMNMGYKNSISFDFMEEINKKDFLSEILKVDLEDKIKKNKYSEGYEALISCFKKLFFALLTKTIILNEIKNSNKILNPDIYEYFINPFIFYCYASLDSLAFFLNEYFSLGLKNSDCDLLRYNFKNAINKKIKLKGNDFSQLEDIKKIISNQVLLDLKKYRNNISHRFTIILPFSETTKERIIIKNPKSNFMSFTEKFDFKNDFYSVETFLENFFNETKQSILNILNLIF